MRFHRLALRGISEAFREHVEVDFDSLGPGLIAIVGENGAGKSTLIGSIFAGLFRQLPGQKRSLYDFCTHPEPEIDLHFSVSGRRYRSLLKLNPRARQMESYVFDGDGAAKASGKKEAFEEVIRRAVGTSKEFFLASIFSSQKRTGNFLALDRAERKELFVSQLLGLERLRLISATAKAFADEARQQLLELEGELRGLNQIVAGEANLENVGELTKLLTGLKETLGTAEHEKEEVNQKLQDLQGRLAGRQGLETQKADLLRRRERVAREIERTRRLVEEDKQQLAGCERLDVVEERAREIAARIDELHRRLRETREAEAANVEVERTIGAIEAELHTSRAELERSKVEAGELAAVPCGGEGSYASCPKIRRAVEAGAGLKQLEGAIGTLALELGVQRGGLVPIPTTSAKLLKNLQEMERLRNDAEEQRRRREQLEVIEARRQERAARLEQLGREKTELEEQVSRIGEEIESFQGLDQTLAAVKQRLLQLEKQISSLRSDREGVVVRKAQAEQARRQIEEARRRASAVGARIDTARTEKEDYDYLAKVFGPDEIQLCEIQSAGPSVSSIVNELLEGCLDNKFEIRFRTQRPRANGRGMVDDFDIEVRNKTLDRSCLIDELSGGQFVLVNEAVNLAIAIYNTRQSGGVNYETLFRDETIGALDGTNAKEYIRMLRQAMELGGFHQVIFICHAPNVWDLADRVLRVADGRVFAEGASAEVGVERPEMHEP